MIGQVFPLSDSDEKKIIIFSKKKITKKLENPWKHGTYTTHRVCVASIYCFCSHITILPPLVVVMLSYYYSSSWLQCFQIIIRLPPHCYCCCCANGHFTFHTRIINAPTSPNHPKCLYVRRPNLFKLWSLACMSVSVSIIHIPSLPLSTLFALSLCSTTTIIIINVLLHNLFNSSSRAACSRWSEISLAVYTYITHNYGYMYEF